MAYYVRDHVDKAEFAAEVVRYCSDDGGLSRWWDRFPYAATNVDHVYYRNVPVGRDAPGEMIMVKCHGPARGAYPVTEIDLDHLRWTMQGWGE